MLYPSGYLDAVCSSAGGPAPPLADDPAFDDDSSSKESLSSPRRSGPLPTRDQTVPLDFELRESGVPGRRLGIWSCRRINVGECFGPCKGEHRTALQHPSQDFQVGDTAGGIFLSFPSDRFGGKSSDAQIKCLNIQIWMELRSWPSLTEEQKRRYLNNPPTKGL